MTAQQQQRRPISGEELDAIKQELLDRKKNLWNEILHKLSSEAAEQHQQVVDIMRENGDQALENLRESYAISLVEMRVKELDRIEAALNRIENGQYGRCIDCNRWIKPGRLKAMPYSVRCIKCKEALERIENV
ncbi:MAG: TraR/DksA family transcriptional regulator [Thermodesulfobacteriota bacterium]